jgi:hypothetical protein
VFEAKEIGGSFLMSVRQIASSSSILVLISLSSGALVSCGDSDEEEKQTIIVPALISGEEQSNVEEQAASQLQDAVDAISAVDAGGISLALEDEAGNGRSPTRSCVKDSDTQVTVTSTLVSTEEGTREAGRLNGLFKKSMDSTVTDVWTRAPGATEAIECSVGNNAKVRWTQASEVNGLSLNVSVNRSHSVQVTWSGSRRNGEVISLDTSRTFVSSGTRSITHSDHSFVEGNSLSFIRTITSEVSRNLSGSRRKQGGLSGETEPFSLVHQVVVSEESPLKVKTEFDLTGGQSGSRSWTQKTIESGTATSTSDESGTRVVSTFSNVVFAAGGCIPQSGTVSGSIFPKDPADAEATSTFVITFGAETDSTVSIAYDGGEAVDYPAAEEYLEGCDFSNLLRVKP